MAVDALALFFANTSVAMVVAMQHTQNLVFYKQAFKFQVQHIL